MTFDEINMRELNAKDIFPMVAILKKIGFSKMKDVLEGMDITEEDNATKIGYAVILAMVETVIENLDRCENELFSFLASVCQCEQSDIEGMGLGEFAMLLKGIFDKEEFKDFFKAVSGFIQ